jgi:predicted methyltransferase
MRPIALLSVLALAAVAGAEEPPHDHRPGEHRPDEPLVHRFQRPASDYAKMFDAPGRDKWQKPREVMRLLELRPGMTVADIGAGTGYFAPHLSRQVGKKGQVLALDIEPQLVEHINERARRARLANVVARQVAPDDPKLEPESVDRVLLVDTWHHIPAREAYGKKLVAGLRPGGRVVIVEVTRESPHGPPQAHRLDPEEVVRELEAAGLAAEIVKESLPRQYVVVGTRRPAS